MVFRHENPTFLDLSAPPVANGASAGSIGIRMLKLTSNYEGLSFGLAEKKTRTEVTKTWSYYGFSQISTLKKLGSSCISCVLCKT